MNNLTGPIAVFALFLCSGPVSAASQQAAERIAAGRKLLDQGKVEAAIKEFQKAVATDPQPGAALLNLGQAYERANRPDDAIDAYRRSAELEPRNFYARNNLGVLYDKQGKYDEAIAEFENALKTEPDNAMGLKNLETAKTNKVAIREQNVQISRAQKAVEAKPKDPESAYQLARVHASHGKKESAIEWLRKAIQLGYKDLAYIKADPAFAGIHKEREFELLLLKR